MDAGAGKLSVKARGEIFGTICDVEAAKAAIGSGHEDIAERGSESKVADGHAVAGGTVLGGRHSEVRVDPLVKTAGGGKAGIVEGLGNSGVIVAEIALEALDAAAELELLGSEAQSSFELALEMEGTVAGETAHFGERDGFLRVIMEVAGEESNGIHGLGQLRFGTIAEGGDDDKALAAGAFNL